MTYVQEKVFECKACNMNKKFFRNASKPNYLLHLILIIITAGLWTVPFLMILILGVRIGGDSFTCSSCGGKYQSRIEKVFSIVVGFVAIVFIGLLALALLGALIGKAIE